MRKISEIKNEDALDVIADIIDPVIEICADQKFKKEFESGNRGEAIRLLIKAHKKAVLAILAALDGESIETYQVNIVQIPTKLFELFNDKDMIAFFQSQGLKISGISFGSATENTEETETK